MKYIAFIILLLSVTHCCVAQRGRTKNQNKAEDLYNRGLQKASDGAFSDAVAMLQEAVRADPRFTAAYLSLGGIYREMKDYTSAVSAYEKAKAIDSLSFLDFSLPYSINLAALGQFDKALEAVNRFLTIKDLSESSRRAGEYRRQCYAFAIAYEKNRRSNYVFEPKNLGDNINSEVSEYFPALTIDGSRLIYTRRVNHLNEDFFGATRGPDGLWGSGESLPGDINSPRNEGAQNISQDGEWLLFTGCDFPEGFGSCDLYISFLNSSGWSPPENLGPAINTESWESAPSLSPDKRELYFSSNRPGGYGKSDIYISRRGADGRWSPAQNAGPLINTPGNENCPFMHADNQSLYFTSDGHPGYGGEDLQLATRTGDTSWSPAVNLGYPINTIENESSMIVAADGKTAYYASDRSDSRGGMDLYTFTLREDVRPARTLWVKGRVYDANTKKGLPSAVELTDLQSRRLLNSVQTDETGNYLITLPVGKDYAFNVNRKGYLFFSENFRLSDQSVDSTFQIDIPLQPIESNAAVVLKNIFFDVNKFDLKASSYAELDHVIRLLRENPSVRISINGHTDNTGNAADNLVLSKKRAKAVTDYMITKGIARQRLAAIGSGSTQPVAENNTEQGRAMNRRTEMRVTGK